MGGEWVAVAHESTDAIGIAIGYEANVLRMLFKEGD